MSYASSRLRSVSTIRGFSLLEILVAMAVATAFLAGAYTVFIQTLQEYDRLEARSEAVRNARSAINSLSDELREISANGADFLLVGVDNNLLYGDGIDNDNDGDIDEERFDGLNNDNPGALPSAIDRHATLISLQERPLKAGVTDLGDLDVDEDPVWGQDLMIFRVYPTNPTPGVLFKTITYAITDYDGQSNVLVRQVRIEPSDDDVEVAITPIAFGVMGFDVLYWDPNASPAEQRWVTSWDSSDAASFDYPRLPLPASIYVRLTMFTDSRPPEIINEGDPVDVLIMQTMLNVEQTISDAQFPRPIL